MKKTYIKCREGWVVTEPWAGGRVRVNATGHRPQVVEVAEVFGLVAELTRALGGRARQEAVRMLDPEDHDSELSALMTSAYRDSLTIRARITDDGNPRHIAHFDARDYFQEAEVEQLLELAKNEFCRSYAADAVAEHYFATTLRDWCAGCSGFGYEVYVNTDDALRWLASFRPEVFRSLPSRQRSLVNFDLLRESGDDDGFLDDYLQDVGKAKVVLQGVAITEVLSRDGLHRGQPTGGSRSCFDGCGGRRIGVRWGDGKLTWVCSRALKITGNIARIL